MSRSLTPTSGARFFSTFQRYICLTTSSQHHIHHRPQTYIQTQLPTQPPTNPSTARFASTSASPNSAPSPHRQPDKALLYSLFPSTLPHGPPPHGPFPIDLKRLRAEFLQLQAKAHPDRHPGADKARAEGTSALINTAYKTLQSPLLRAQYLLSLRGIDVAEDESLKSEDEELLMEVMDVRERIEGAGEEGELEGLKGGNEGRIRESEGVLERCFREDDVEGAKGEAVRLRYWINIKESLDGWERGKPVVLVH